MFSRVSIKKRSLDALMASWLVLLLSACSNPLGAGEQPGSSVNDAFRPGLIAGKFPDHLVLLSTDNQSAIVGDERRR